MSDCLPLLSFEKIGSAIYFGKQRHRGTRPAPIRIASHVHGQTCDGYTETSQCVRRSCVVGNPAQNKHFQPPRYGRHHLNDIEATTTASTPSALESLFAPADFSQSFRNPSPLLAVT
jgi:hypothetical protein